MEGRLENDFYRVIRVYEVEIKIVFRVTTLSQTVLESSLVGRVIAFRQGREIRLAFVI